MREESVDQKLPDARPIDFRRDRASDQAAAAAEHRNGVFAAGIAISGQPINGATPVGPETVLRLAASGPYLEFRIGRRLNTHAERLADQQRWAARDREEEQSRTDVTDVDFLNRRDPHKPAR